MKIACILGSPREKGNSATPPRRFLDTAEALSVVDVPERFLAEAEEAARTITEDA